MQVQLANSSSLQIVVPSHLLQYNTTYQVVLQNGICSFMQHDWCVLEHTYFVFMAAPGIGFTYIFLCIFISFIFVDFITRTLKLLDKTMFSFLRFFFAALARVLRHINRGESDRCQAV